MRRATARAWRPLVLLAVLTASFVAPHLASASGVAVSGGTLSVRSISSPCPGVATAAPAAPAGGSGARFDAVAVTLPPGCGVHQVRLELRDRNPWRSGSATLDGSGVVLLDHHYTARSDTVVVATLDGWDLPVAWSLGAP
ncbi:hypothetical protein Q6348_05480 [Isoptericola sp. b441]|uniref:Uncharacterized protein n=1 Tax=Actinotalea lenta TaxID=3064654 RepID=A0ABT9DBE7_9CELL|nr:MULTISPECIES: hypothetical protein [unclassified Isoptericola]MDO8106646.1 hypothetical protein [Isoptericola sp. b441]MDO8121646.1 hypothetical protein [Isoptericola sp. b490]